MKKYVVFLRAINVGGNTVIKMTDLKRMFESFGLKNVQTYIQTGNVICESEADNVSVLAGRIERGLEAASGKRIQIFVRTMRDVSTMAGQCPFDPKAHETAYVVILNKKPGRKSEEALMALRSEADDFAVNGMNVYNLRRDREKSVFSNNFVEQVLGMPATTRNLTTIKKLVQKYK